MATIINHKLYEVVKGFVSKANAEKERDHRREQGYYTHIKPRRDKRLGRVYDVYYSIRKRKR